MLPQDFKTLITDQLGASEAEKLFDAIENTPSPVSVRINESKNGIIKGTEVPWCPLGRYLSERPQFTLDPLLHAGTYYVQEASSMYLWQILKQYLPDDTPVQALDLCAAPGGKSTLTLSALPKSSLLISNEPMRQRAQILRENIIKWGAANSIVTNNFPIDFQGLGEIFDVIICDAPCSGEGMFRKDKESIREWSLTAVQKCQERQREIITHIWDNLRPGGIFIYSTCTYNHFEDEDNLAWILEEYDAETLPLPHQEEWNITNGHFYPHKTQGEGFYIAAVRKAGDSKAKKIDRKKISKKLHILLDGIESGHIVDKKKGTIEPSHSQAMDSNIDLTKWNTAEISLDDALSYLRSEPIKLSEKIPKGYVLLTYQGHPLGFVKNLGNRANNLYPDEWRIRKL